jgi:hypothetical protein
LQQCHEHQASRPSEVVDSSSQRSASAVSPSGRHLAHATAAWTGGLGRPRRWSFSR